MLRPTVGRIAIKRHFEAGVLKMPNHISVVLRFTFLAAALSCLGACGGGGRTELTNTTVSTGQQLMDLKKALDSGAISQAEYDKKRKEILAAK
jgi:hypothetical protein